MTYSEFQQYCARFGFIDTPLTEDQFDHCVDVGLSIEGMYNVACDIAGDIEFNTAVSGNLYQGYDDA
jgi:hypothetical protein